MRCPESVGSKWSVATEKPANTPKNVFLSLRKFLFQERHFHVHGGASGTFLGRALLGGVTPVRGVPMGGFGGELAGRGLWGDARVMWWLAMACR